MLCPKCSTPLGWQNDYDAQDLGYDEDFSIISQWACGECNTFVEIAYSSDKQEGE